MSRGKETTKPDGVAVSWSSGSYMEDMMIIGREKRWEEKNEQKDHVSIHQKKREIHDDGSLHDESKREEEDF